jgi:hypothetical protein
MTETQWRELIDASFGAGPESATTPHEVVRAGRRALVRRRRAAGLTGGGLLISTTLIAGAVTLSVDASAPDRTSPPSAVSAADEPRVEAGSSGPAAPHREVYRTAVGLVTLDRETGALDLPDGWRELDRIEDPTGPGSLALEIADGSRRMYLLATSSGAEGWLVAYDQDGSSTLEEFVDGLPDDLLPQARQGGA